MKFRDLKPGTRFAIEVENVDGRLRVVPCVRIGNTGVRNLAPPKTHQTDEQVLVEIEMWAQNELAQLGRERTERG